MQPGSRLDDETAAEEDSVSTEEDAPAIITEDDMASILDEDAIAEDAVSTEDAVLREEEAIAREDEEMEDDDETFSTWPASVVTPASPVAGLDSGHPARRTAAHTRRTRVMRHS